MIEQYFEDFAVGQTFNYRTRIACRQRTDRHFREAIRSAILHLDEEAAKNRPFKGLAASGWHTAGMTMRLMARRRIQTRRRHYRRRLRRTELVAPGSARRRILCQKRILEVRPSKSRNDRGMIRVQTTTSIKTTKSCRCSPAICWCRAGRPQPDDHATTSDNIRGGA